jgi:hypothetical protein
VVKNKTPTAVWQWGFSNYSNAIRTRPPRGKAARLAADSDSSCDSRGKGSSLDSAGQIVFFLSNRRFSPFHSTFTFKVEDNSGASR